MVRRAFFVKRIEKGRKHVRFLHTADWHIGKKLHGYSLLEEQKDAFSKLLTIAEEEKVDAIVIAGDLYDRSVPSVDAVEVLNEMMITMNLKKKYPVLAISGNHDSASRLETGSPWFAEMNFHLHTRLEQAFHPIEIEDTQFFLLPYFEPMHARRYFEDEEIRTIAQAMEKVTAEIHSRFKPGMSHVLVTHFFIAGSSTTDSETKLTVGGLDTVPLDLLRAFDYVALGHLHSKNALNEPRVKYSGSLLKFSLSEINLEKGVLIVDSSLETTETRFRAIQPLREIKQFEGSFQELTSLDFSQSVNKDDFIHFRLTDREIIPNMTNQLQQLYPKIIGTERINRQFQASEEKKYLELERLNPEEIVHTFFTEMTGERLTPEQERWLKEGFATLEEKNQEV